MHICRKMFRSERVIFARVSAANALPKTPKFFGIPLKLSVAQKSRSAHLYIASDVRALPGASCGEREGFALIAANAPKLHTKYPTRWQAKRHILYEVYSAPLIAFESCQRQYALFVRGGGVSRYGKLPSSRKNYRQNFGAFVRGGFRLPLCRKNPQRT